MKSIGQIALVAALVFASGQAIAAETIIGEAEDFRIGKGDWKRQKYGENYYVGTFADTFLSRKAFLGAPEQCKPSLASLRVNIPAPGPISRVGAV